MSNQISITAGKVTLQGELNDSPTAKAILKALPIKARGNRWGGEIYFAIPVKAKPEPDNSRDVLQAGDLGYWPVGNAFCIFFGRTPASQENEIRAASDVTIIGKIIGDVSVLWNVADDAEVIIKSAADA